MISGPLSDAERLGAAMFQPDPALLEQGWNYRFVAFGSRLAEAQQLYGELGFEVRAEEIRKESFPEGCDDCQLILIMNFRALYTRKPSG